MNAPGGRLGRSVVSHSGAAGASGVAASIRSGDALFVGLATLNHRLASDPDARSSSSRRGGRAMRGAWALAFQMYSAAVQQHHVSPTIHHVNALLSITAHERLWPQFFAVQEYLAAQQLPEEMEERSASDARWAAAAGRPDSSSASSSIAVQETAASLAADAARELGSLRPNEQTFQILMTAALRAGDWQEALESFADIQRETLPISGESVALAMAAFATPKAPRDVWRAALATFRSFRHRIRGDDPVPLAIVLELLVAAGQPKLALSTYHDCSRTLAVDHTALNAVRSAAEAVSDWATAASLAAGARAARLPLAEQRDFTSAALIAARRSGASAAAVDLYRAVVDSRRHAAASAELVSNRALEAVAAAAADSRQLGFLLTLLEGSGGADSTYRQQQPVLLAAVVDSALRCAQAVGRPSVEQERLLALLVKRGVDKSEDPAHALLLEHSRRAKAQSTAASENGETAWVAALSAFLTRVTNPDGVATALVLDALAHASRWAEAAALLQKLHDDATQPRFIGNLSSARKSEKQQSSMTIAATTAVTALSVRLALRAAVGAQQPLAAVQLLRAARERGWMRPADVADCAVQLLERDRGRSDMSAVVAMCLRENAEAPAAPAAPRSLVVVSETTAAASAAIHGVLSSLQTLRGSASAPVAATVAELCRHLEVARAHCDPRLYVSLRPIAFRAVVSAVTARCLQSQQPQQRDANVADLAAPFATLLRLLPITAAAATADDVPSVFASLRELVDVVGRRALSSSSPGDSADDGRLVAAVARWALDALESPALLPIPSAQRAAHALLCDVVTTLAHRRDRARALALFFRVDALQQQPPIPPTVVLVVLQCATSGPHAAVLAAWRRTVRPLLERVAASPLFDASPTVRTAVAAVCDKLRRTITSTLLLQGDDDGVESQRAAATDAAEVLLRFAFAQLRRAGDAGDQSALLLKTVWALLPFAPPAAAPASLWLEATAAQARQLRHATGETRQSLVRVLVKNVAPWMNAAIRDAVADDVLVGDIAAVTTLLSDDGSGGDDDIAVEFTRAVLLATNEQRPAVAAAVLNAAVCDGSAGRLGRAALVAGVAGAAAAKDAALLGLLLRALPRLLASEVLEPSDVEEILHRADAASAVVVLRWLREQRLVRRDDGVAVALLRAGAAADLASQAFLIGDAHARRDLASLFASFSCTALAAGLTDAMREPNVGGISPPALSLLIADHLAPVLDAETVSRDGDDDAPLVLLLLRCSPKFQMQLLEEHGDVVRRHQRTATAVLRKCLVKVSLDAVREALADENAIAEEFVPLALDVVRQRGVLSADAFAALARDVAVRRPAVAPVVHRSLSAAVIDDAVASATSKQRRRRSPSHAVSQLVERVAHRVDAGAPAPEIFAAAAAAIASAAADVRCASGSSWWVACTPERLRSAFDAFPQLRAGAALVAFRALAGGDVATGDAPAALRLLWAALRPLPHDELRAICDAWHAALHAADESRRCAVLDAVGVLLAEFGTDVVDSARLLRDALLPVSKPLFDQPRRHSAFALIFARAACDTNEANAGERLPLLARAAVPLGAWKELLWLLLRLFPASDRAARQSAFQLGGYAMCVVAASARAQSDFTAAHATQVASLLSPAFLRAVFASPPPASASDVVRVARRGATAAIAAGEPPLRAVLRQLVEQLGAGAELAAAIPGGTEEFAEIARDAVSSRKQTAKIESASWLEALELLRQHGGNSSKLHAAVEGVRNALENNVVARGDWLAALAILTRVPTFAHTPKNVSIAASSLVVPAVVVVASGGGWAGGLALAAHSLATLPSRGATSPPRATAVQQFMAFLTLQTFREGSKKDNGGIGQPHCWQAACAAFALSSSGGATVPTKFMTEILRHVAGDDEHRCAARVLAAYDALLSHHARAASSSRRGVGVARGAQLGSVHAFLSLLRAARRLEDASLVDRAVRDFVAAAPFSASANAMFVRALLACGFLDAESLVRARDALARCVPPVLCDADHAFFEARIAKFRQPRREVSVARSE